MVTMVACELRNTPIHLVKLERDTRYTMDVWRKITSMYYALVVAECLLSASWVVLGNQQTMKLKTRDSDGAAVCAQGVPSRRAMISAKMSSAPAVVGCIA